MNEVTSSVVTRVSAAMCVVLLASCGQADDASISCLDAISTPGPSAVHAIRLPTKTDMYDGVWEWAETCGGFAGTCESPSTTGKSATIVLKDSEFSYCENNAVVASGIYTIIAANPEDEIHYVTDAVSWPDEHYIYLTTEDQLILDEGCCDRFAMSFDRVE